jgi:hypothetical protein
MGRGRRRHQHELPLVANRAHGTQPPGSPVSRGALPVRQPDDVRPDLGHDRWPPRPMRGDEHLPARDGVLFLQLG